MSKNRQNKTTKAALAGKLSVGTGKHFPPGQEMPVSGVTLTVPAIQAKLSSFAQLRQKVEDAHAALEAAIAAENAQAPDMDAFVAAFVHIVRGAFGKQPDVLADFGLKAPKVRTPMTADQAAAAVAKRKATRVARGTKGPKAKQAIHGNVTGVVVTPVTGAGTGTGPTGGGAGNAGGGASHS
jgi:hypothetical protein